MLYTSKLTPMFGRLNIHARRISVEAITKELDANPHRLNEQACVDGVGEWTPLAFACHNWNWDLAFSLIDRGADVNILNTVSIVDCMDDERHNKHTYLPCIREGSQL
jgi:hypothetical protein